MNDLIDMLDKLFGKSNHAHIQICVNRMGADVNLVSPLTQDMMEASELSEDQFGKMVISVMESCRLIADAILLKNPKFAARVILIMQALIESVELGENAPTIPPIEDDRMEQFLEASTNFALDWIRTPTGPFVIPFASDSSNDEKPDEKPTEEYPVEAGLLPEEFEEFLKTITGGENGDK